MLSCPRCGADLSKLDENQDHCPECRMLLPELAGPRQASDTATTPAGEDGAPQHLPKPRAISPEYERHLYAKLHATYGASERMSKETIRSDRSEPSDTSQRLRDWSVVLTKGLAKAPVNADYELLEQIGEGGMARVWSARQSSLDRDVAVKIPHPPDSHLDEDSKCENLGRITAQFMSEVLVTGKLEHPNIVPIYDLGRDSTGKPLYSMKRLRGYTWDDLIDHYDEPRNLEVLMKVCDAIAFAHSKGFLHMDIKPDNIWAGEFGEVAVFDWGVAVEFDLGEGGSDAGHGGIPGFTPAYAAPEMVAGKQVGPATDVYLLGAVLYEVVTGRPPHDWTGNAQDDALKAARNEILSVATEQQGELIEIALRAMQTEPENRFRSVQLFQDALREYQSHRESLQLSARAIQFLEAAGESGDYEDFQRAVFGFQNALDLWPDNADAAKGLKRARLEYARSARGKRDYELCLGLLDRSEPDQQEEIRLLEKEKTESDLRSARLRRARRLLLAGGCAFAVVVTILSGWLLITRNSLLLTQEKLTHNVAELERTNTSLEETTGKLKENEGKLIHTNELLTTEKKTALASRDEAIKARSTAKDSEKAARRSERDAIETSYAFEMGLAKSELDRNSFGYVTKILDEASQAAAEYGADAESGTDSERIAEAESRRLKRKLRHWEWGHLKYSLEYRDSERIADDPTQRYEAVDISRDGRWLVAGTADGYLRVWRAGVGKQQDGDDFDQQERQHPAPPQEIHDETLGDAILSVSLSYDGRLVAAVVRDREEPAKPYAIKIRRLRVDEGRDRLEEVDNSSYAASLRRDYRSRFLSVAFSPVSHKLLAATADADGPDADWDGEALLWTLSADGRIQNGQARAFGGHVGKVFSARLSSDETQIVTAGEDKTVRVWATAQRTEQLRYHHGDIVHAACFSPLNRFVVSAGKNGRVVAWPNVTRNGADSSVRKQQVTKIQKRVEDTPEEEIGMREGGQILGSHDMAVDALSIAGHGENWLVFSAGRDNTVRVWEVSDKDGGPLGVAGRKTLRGHGGWVQSCAATRDGKYVLSGGIDGQVRIWDWREYFLPRVLARSDDVGGVPAPLNMAAYSRDSRWIVTAYDDGQIRVWEIRDYDVLSRPALDQGHAFLATHAEPFLFAGRRRLLTSAVDNTAHTWDFESGAHLCKLGTNWNERGGTGYRGVAGVSRDGRWVLTGSDEEQITAKIWNSETGAFCQGIEVDQETERNPQLTAVAFRSPAQATGNHREVAFLGDERGGCYWAEVPSGKVLTSWYGHSGKISAAVFLPDNTFLTASVDGRVRRWEYAEGQMRQTGEPLVHDDAVLSLDVSRDGRYALTSCGSRDASAIVRLWDLETSEVRASLGHAQVVGSLLARGNGMQVASVATTTVGDESESFAMVRSVDLSADGSAALITVFDPRTGDCRVAEWVIASSEPTGLPAISDAASARYAPEDHQLLVVQAKGARLYDRPQFKVARDFNRQASARAASFSPDSRSLAIGGGDGSIAVWGLEDDGKWAHQFSEPNVHEGPVTSVAYDPQHAGNAIITAGEDGSVKIHEVDERGLRSNLAVPNHKSAVNCAVFSADGQRIATASKEDITAIWKVERDENRTVKSVTIIRTLKDPEQHQDERAQYVTFSLDGRLLVTASGKMAKVWDANSGELLVRTQEGHAEEINSIAVSHDARRILTASNDSTVKVWETRELKGTLDQMITLEDHTGPVSSVAFSPNGQHVITAGADGRAIIWPGVCIEPSISLRENEMEYTIGVATKMEIAAGAMLITPTAVDFSGGVLTVELRVPESVGAEGTGNAEVDGANGVLGKLVCELAETPGLSMEKEDHRLTISCNLVPSGSEIDDNSQMRRELETVLRSIKYYVEPDQPSVSTNSETNPGESREVAAQLGGDETSDSRVVEVVLRLENVNFLHCEGQTTIVPKVEEKIAIQLYSSD